MAGPELTRTPSRRPSTRARSASLAPPSETRRFTIPPVATPAEANAWPAIVTDATSLATVDGGKIRIGATATLYACSGPGQNSPQEQHLALDMLLGELVSSRRFGQREPPGDGDVQLPFGDGPRQVAESLGIRAGHERLHGESLFLGSRGLTEHAAQLPARFELSEQLLNRLAAHG